MSNPRTDRFIVFGGTCAQLKDGFPWEFYVDHADTLEEASGVAEQAVSTGFDFDWFHVVDPAENRVIAVWSVLRHATPRTDLETDTDTVVGAVKFLPRLTCHDTDLIWAYLVKDRTVQNRWITEEEPFTPSGFNLATWHTTEKSS